MYLIIDVGNTRTKLAVFDRQELICSEVCTKVDLLSRVEEILQKYTCTKAILAAVGGLASPERNAIHSKLPLLELSHTTAVPFQHQYATPDTLGVDRIALVSGAVTRYPGKPVLVIDAGTCITYDFVGRDGIYRGGGISPGLQTRYKSLHTFTNKLPDLKASIPENLVGNTTQESMHAGVVYGLLFEIDGFIDSYTVKNKDLTVVLTGGDSNFLSDKLKNSIFANPNLLLEGLNSILTHNL